MNHQQKIMDLIYRQGFYWKKCDDDRHTEKEQDEYYRKFWECVQELASYIETIAGIDRKTALEMVRNTDKLKERLQIA